MKKQLLAIIILIISLLSNIINAYNERDLQSLYKTKQCIDCNLEYYKVDTINDFESLDNINVSGSRLQGFELAHTVLRDINFSNTDLTESVLHLYLNFKHYQLVNAKDDVELSTIDFGSASFNNANLSNATLLGDLNNVDFSYANFSKLNSNVNNHDYEIVDPEVVNALVNNFEYDFKPQFPLPIKVPLFIRNSRLINANFKDANLFNVTFENSDLSGAVFTNANLHGADFTGSNVTLTQIKKARVIHNVILPNGKVVNANLQDEDGSISVK